MSLVRGKLRKGFYIRKKKEKIYISTISKKRQVVYAGKSGKGSLRFKTKESAIDYLTLYNLNKDHKFIEVY